jgi:hypothetical protein
MLLGGEKRMGVGFRADERDRPSAHVGEVTLATDQRQAPLRAIAWPAEARNERRLHALKER